jgi:hypothetical protein
MFHVAYSLEAMYAAHYPTHNITLFTSSTRVTFYRTHTLFTTVRCCGKTQLIYRCRKVYKSIYQRVHQPEGSDQSFLQ